MHTAPAAHSVAAQSLSQAAEHDHEASPLASTSWCECEPSTSSSSHSTATAFDARGCIHPECRVPQLPSSAPQPQREHAEHQRCIHCIHIARMSHLQSAIAGQRPSHRAAPAHTVARCTMPLQPTASQHSRCRRLLSKIMRYRRLQARAGASASHPRVVAATALPLHSMHEGAATLSAECLSCHHQRRSRRASMLSTTMHPLHSRSQG